MLELSHIIILSLIQGITEFLPVSSSAHLIFIPKLLGWEDQGLAFDVAVHAGTLIAVLFYFRKDLIKMIKDFFRSLKGESLSPSAKLFWGLGFATIPVGLFGLFFNDIVETSLRSPLVIGLTTIIFGGILWLAYKLGKDSRPEEGINWKDVLVIGCGQALALIPGTSRSGITLTAGLAMGLTREAAARFSFMLAIPVIVLASGFESMALIKENSLIDWRALSLGFILSGVSGYFCIHWFINFLTKVGVLPFVIYRLFLGGLLLFLFV